MPRRVDFRLIFCCTLFISRSKKRRLDYLCPSDDEDNGAPSKQIPRTTQWRFQPVIFLRRIVLCHSHGLFVI